jgi:hypothetical protein
MSTAVDDVVDELIGEGRVQDPGRRNELRVELVKALNALANRVDRGYGVEVRAGELPESAEGDEAAMDGEPDDEFTADTRRAAALIRENRKALQFLKLSGEPILGLPEVSEDPDDGPARH